MDQKGHIMGQKGLEIWKSEKSGPKIPSLESETTPLICYQSHQINNPEALSGLNTKLSNECEVYISGGRVLQHRHKIWQVTSTLSQQQPVAMK